MEARWLKKWAHVVLESLQVPMLTLEQRVEHSTKVHQFRMQDFDCPPPSLLSEKKRIFVFFEKVAA